MAFRDSWKIPPNANTWFSAEDEKNLKQQYGFHYGLHLAFAIVMLFLPLVVFFLLTPSNAFDPATQMGNVLGAVGFVLGLVGSLAIGVGLVNVFMSLIKRYLGHFITLISITVGVALDGIGLLLFYSVS